MQTKFVLCVQDGEGWNSFPKRVAKSHVSLTNTIFPSKRAEASFGIRGTQTRLNTSGGQNLLSFFPPVEGAHSQQLASRSRQVALCDPAVLH